MLTPRGRGGPSRRNGPDTGSLPVPGARAPWQARSRPPRHHPAADLAWPSAAALGVIGAGLVVAARARGHDTAGLLGVLELGAAAGALAGARLLAPERPLPWHLAAGGLAAGGVAQLLIAASAAGVVDARAPASALTLAGLGLGSAAGVALVVIRAWGWRAELLLSVAATVLAVALLAAEMLRPPLTLSAEGLPQVVAALAALIGALALSRWPARGQQVVGAWLLVGAATVWMAHKVLAVAGMMAIGAVPAPIMAGLLPLSLGLLAAVCLHPSGPALADPVPPPEPSQLDATTSGWHVAALGLALLVLPLVSLSLALREPASPPGWVWLMVLGMVGLIALVLARLRGLVTSLHTTTALRQAEARSDVTTGLPNARALLEDLELRAVDGGRPALLVVTLTGIGEAESVYGFDASAELVRTLAGRLQATVPPEATVAVLSRRELGVVVSGEDEALVPFGWRLCRQASRPAAVSGGVIGCAAVVGVARRGVGEAAEALLRRAELARRWAQRPGAHRVQRYELAMASRVAYEVSIRSRIRQAVSGDELQLWCQPQVELATGRLAGVEFLARWRDARHGFVSPTEFVPAARDAGVAAELDTRMLNAAARQAARWREAGVIVPSVAVNVEPTTLSQPGFVDEVASALRHAGLPPRSLAIELTEAVTAHDHDQAREVLWGLRALGVRLAVDDFGTGYSSLADLHHLPMDVVKLDRELVSVLEDEPVLVTASIVLAERLGLQLIAEGVETGTQLDELKRLGCEIAQGFLLARPMPAESLPQWRRRRRTVIAEPHPGAGAPTGDSVVVPRSDAADLG